jgi:UPF0271 protein
VTSIDLNADLAEGFGAWRLGDDEALFDVVTSASVACGFHAGDPRLMRHAGLTALGEGFADRGYRADGTLVPRSAPGALVESPSAVAEWAVRMAVDGEVVAVDGTVVRCAVRSICLHGDTPGAVELARQVRASLTAAGIEVARFS